MKMKQSNGETFDLIESINNNFISIVKLIEYSNTGHNKTQLS